MKKFIDFMLGQEFQKALPDNMYVYPVDPTVALPDSWAAYAKTSPKPYSLPAATVAESTGLAPLADIEAARHRIAARWAQAGKEGA